jgi:type IV secretory pathway VirB4 component
VRDWLDLDDPGTGEEPVAGWLPDRIQVGPRHIRTDNPAGAQYCASLAVVGYPRQVYPGWLTPLLCYPGRLDVSLHIEPVPTQIAARRLRQQLARLESSRALDADKGRLADPRTDAAAADAEELATRLARGETRLHRVGLYLTLHANCVSELAEHARAVRALASSMLLDARPTSYRALQGWTTTLPIGIDAIGRTRVMDTDGLACMIPLPSLESPGPAPATDPTFDPVSGAPPPGVFYGHNLATGGLVFHDRFTAPNHNAVILAASGAGKSYLAKLELLRSLYRGIEVIVIDPEDEYARLATRVGGTHLRLGATGVRINPLDLPHARPQPTQPPPVHPAAPEVRSPRAGGDTPPPTGGDVLTRRALYMHTVLGVLLGELTAHERVLADQAIHTTYTRAGITYDRSTWTRPAPLLADLATSFRDLGNERADPAATDLAHRLTPYVSGSFRTLFDGPTSTQPVGHLVVFSLKDLPDQLQGIGTLLALDATWRTITNPAARRPRLVLVDEAWLLLQHPAGAAFLLRLAKAARKHWAGLTLITQDATDLLATDLGRAVISNAATHILLRTAPQAGDRIAAEYGLTEPERGFLTTATTGHALLITHSGHHIPFAADASTNEDLLATTSPEFLASHQDSGRNSGWMEL